MIYNEYEYLQLKKKSQIIILDALLLCESYLELLINATPTSKHRNDLTDESILLKDKIRKLKEKL